MVLCCVSLLRSPTWVPCPQSPPELGCFLTSGPSALQVADSQDSSHPGSDRGPFTKVTWDISCRNADDTLQKRNTTITLCRVDLIKICSHPKETCLIRPFLSPPTSNPWERVCHFTYKITHESFPFLHLSRQPVGWILITFTTYVGLYLSILIPCFILAIPIHSEHR